MLGDMGGRFKIVDLSGLTTYLSRSLMHLHCDRNYLHPILCADNSQWTFHIPGIAHRPTIWDHFHDRSAQTVEH